MLKELAEYAGKIVHEWCNGETELSRCIQDSEKVLKYHPNDDGYNLAREFERVGYSPDRELVELLDMVSSEAYDIQKKHEIEWVKNYGILLDKQIGDEVTVNVNRKKQTGKIVSLYHDQARYGVRTPEQSDTENWVINFEELQSL